MMEKYPDIFTDCDENGVFVGCRDMGYIVLFATEKDDAIMHIKETLNMVKDACAYLGITLEDL